MLDFKKKKKKYFLKIDEIYYKFFLIDIKKLHYVT